MSNVLFGAFLALMSVAVHNFIYTDRAFNTPADLLRLAVVYGILWLGVVAIQGINTYDGWR